MRSVSVTRDSGVLGLGYARIKHLLHELTKFGVVGVVAGLLDLALFNLFLVGLGLGPLTSKVGSTVVATGVAYVGNRFWTFRHHESTKRGREFTLFIALNFAGLGIAVLCLAVSHYVLGLHSPLADNVSGNVVGFLLSTAFRFYTYRRWVFPAGRHATSELGPEAR